ncbi:hypothetical protein [Planktothrix agardhii]|uniref:hypothetical protein n=1 Tax=Planktothrix agardhii TaxID=1160 RepID=UPI0033407365
MDDFIRLYPRFVKYIPNWLERFYPRMARFARGEGYPCGNKGVFIPRRNKCWTHPKTGQRLKKPLTYQLYKDAKEKSQRSRTEKGRMALDVREQGFREKAREKVKGWKKDKPEDKLSKQVQQKEKVPPLKLVGDGTHKGTPRTALIYHEEMANIGQEITLEEAERRVRAVKNWTKSSYAYIRRSQQSGIPDDEANRIDRLVKTLTPFKGGIYRGITVQNGDDFLKEIKDNNGILEQSAHSSWSSNKKIAEQFAYKAMYRSQPVLIHSTTNKTGASIRKMSSRPFEDEVLVPGGAKHKVKNIVKQEGIIVVEVEEI